MPDFNDLLKTIKDDLLSLTQESLNEFKDELIKDGSAFALKLQDDMLRWGEGLAGGLLTASDIEFLIKAKKDLAEMEALKLAGLSKVKLEKLKNKIVETVIGSVVKVFA
jgi:hypothetical protein